MNKISVISALVLPIVITFFALLLLSRKRDYLSVFITGAKNGIKTSFDIMPTLCLLIIGVNMLSSSGAIDIFEKILAPVFDFLKIPIELLSLIITRPLSSGASIAAFEGVVERCGIDSFEAICASVIMASSDTAFYVISIYFSTTGIKKTRHALPCALLASLLSVFLACAICRIFFE